MFSRHFHRSGYAFFAKSAIDFTPAAEFNRIPNRGWHRRHHCRWNHGRIAHADPWTNAKRVISLRPLKTANKRCLVLAGTGVVFDAGSNCGHRRSRKNSALMVHSWLPPYYNKPSQEGLFRHFSAICEINSASSDALQYSGDDAGVDIAAENGSANSERLPERRLNQGSRGENVDRGK